MKMNREEYESLVQKVRALPESKIYRNSTPVLTLDGIPLTIWDVTKAAVLSNLNTLITGERGDGKTLLENEVKRLFDGRATYIRMKDNLRVQDIYEAFSLEKLSSGKGTTHDARVMTGSVENPLTIIDEVNRGHEKVQNQVFDICDGYIVYDAKKKLLGVPIADGRNYHVVVSSANIGNQRYQGVSPIDSALLDRHHLILNTDNYTPSGVDLAVISLEAKTPKVLDLNDGDHTPEVIEIAKGIENMDVSLDGRISQIFLKKGLEFCTRSDNKSKQSVLGRLPVLCEGCHYLGDGCGYILPVSTRSFIATEILGKGLKLVTDAKRETVEDTSIGYNAILAAFRLITPYGGMLDQNWLDTQYKGNPHFAIEDISRNISTEIEGKRELIQKSFSDALSGKLSTQTVDRFKDRWEFFGGILKEFNSIAAKEGDLIAKDEAELAQLAQKYPVLGWVI
jgi:MoxR-like ATPase